MTRAKAEYALPPRPRAFPAAEDCAVEFGVSAETWRRWVEAKAAPPPVPGSPESAQRWRWADVDDWFTSPGLRAEILRRYEREAAAGVAAGEAETKVVDPFLAGIGMMVDGPPTHRKRRGRPAA